jgi:hypothetical protein
LEPRTPVVRYKYKAPDDIDAPRDGAAIVFRRPLPAQAECWLGAVPTGVRGRPQPSDLYTELPPDEKAATVICFPIRAVGWFQQHGLAIKRMMTDNGGGYILHLSRVGIAFGGARHVRTDQAYTTRTNGKAERFIKTSTRKWAYRWTCQSSA